MIAHSIVVGDQKAPVDGKKAQAILAGAQALDAAIKTVKVGKTNQDVTRVIGQVAEAYETTPLEGVLSHETKKLLLDGTKVIINKETAEQKVPDCDFEPNDVFILDVYVSTGEGKPKESETRATVFKRAIENTYMLKSKIGRSFFTDLNKKYPSLAFSTAAFENEIVISHFPNSLPSIFQETHPVLF